MAKKILVLGGGSAGVMFANRMRKAVGQDVAEITVIEKSDKHIYQPAFTLLVFDLDKPDNLVRPTKDLFYDGINLITDEATKIDPNNNKVSTAKHGDIAYDYLVIATGARLAPEETEGLKESYEKGTNVHTFYKMDGALKLRDALKSMDGGTILSNVCEMPIKCPAAPMKFILMAEDMARMNGVREKFKFVFTTPMPSVFAREPYASALNHIFSSRDIKTIANFATSEVDSDKGVIKSFDGQEVNFDLACVTPPHGGESYLEDTAGGVADAAGWITCDKNLMTSKSFPNVYGIGDATDFPTSKTASGARKQAQVLTQRMKSHLAGKEPEDTYDGHIICPVLTRQKRVMFAEFNYTESISPGIESYMNWVIKVHTLRPLYWNMFLTGLI
jgi:sulfide:quinone oxidoreductase